ncbi:DNA glycosylase [Cyathus striatus]|nr:DNA glycosylase [Cyathus striatus]
MSSLKRPLSARITRLAARQSPYHSSVTLLEAQEDPPDSPRRSKRIKTEIAVKEEVEEERIADLEDLVPNTPKKTKAKPRATKIKKEKVKKVEEEDLPAVKTERGSTISPVKKETPQKSPKKQKPIPQSLAVPHPAPERWREVYDLIKEMRSTFIAPVDTMGCDQSQFRETEPKNRRFATLVSLMLSSQTKDEVTDAAVSKLRMAIGGAISIENMINAEDSVISEAIGKVGFWRRKTGYLKQTAIRLRDHFDSDVPKTVDELCSLPGVGPKMAFLALQVAWDLNEGIGVDVHVHRITNRLGWHRKPTKNPEETRLNLQSWLPKELHREINYMLVGFGQVICLPVGPRCDQCTLATKGLCPSAQKVTKKTTKTKRVTTVKKASAEPEVEVAVEEEQEVMTKKPPVDEQANC